MLQQVETSVDDPIITDNTVMTSAEKRFSAQAYCVLALTCRGKALQVVQRVPKGFEFEAWRQLYEEFEPHPPVKSQGMRQALLASTKSDEPVQMIRQQENRLKVCEEQLDDKASDLQPGRPMAWDLPSQEVLSASEQAGCARRLEARIPQTWHRSVKKRTRVSETEAVRRLVGSRTQTRTSAETSRLARRRSVINTELDSALA